MPEYRLGDVIDDYCVKCKRIMNHSVVSMVDDEPASRVELACQHRVHPSAAVTARCSEG